MVGVGAASDTLAVAAAANNGVGAFDEQYDGSTWVKNKVDGGLIMDSAVNKAGVSVSTSMWQVFVSTDNGATYTNQTLQGLSQDANMYGASNEKMGLVGSWAVQKTDGSPGLDSVSGVASSSDSGATWQLSAGVVWPRYGAFPSDDTWFVSCGIWGDSPAAGQLSARVRSGTGGILETSLDLPRARGKAADAATGWFGTVEKTTDGGKTFKTVFSTDLQNDYLYFNNIACGSELNCVVVAEGDGADGGYLTAAYATNDGGATWAQTHTSTTDASLMAAAYVSGSDSEVWIGGVVKNRGALSGQFYHSTDAGMTWALEQSLDNCYPMDLAFGESVGFASCMSSSGASGSVAVYK
jgi:hypothetical protein